MSLYVERLVWKKELLDDFSADEELKGQGSEHIQPKTKAGYVDHCVVLLGASVFNMLFSKKSRRTHACKVVQNISLRLVREHQVR